MFGSSPKDVLLLHSARTYSRAGILRQASRNALTLVQEHQVLFSEYFIGAVVDLRGQKEGISVLGNEENDFGESSGGSVPEDRRYMFL